MKVSVIVPVYNVEDCIEECLESLVGQTLSDIEIILVNDGSTDASPRICEEYAKKHRSIKLLHQKNSGQSAARNAGLGVATGEYVLFVDSDDYIAPDACKILYNAAVVNVADIVVGDMLNEKDEIERNPSFRYMPAENKSVTVREYAAQSLEYGVYDIVPWIRLVKREFLQANGISFLEGVFYEDQEYTLRLMTQTNGYAVKIRFPFYFYRMQREGSTTTQTSPKKGKDLLTVIEKMQEYVSSLDREGAEIGKKILAISYYHYADLWLRLDKKTRKGQHAEFLNLTKKDHSFNENITYLGVDMKRRVIKTLTSPGKTYLKYRFKKLVKGLLKRR